MPASLGGTLHPNEPEASIPGGGETLEITLSGAAFWVSCGTEFDAQRQGIIDGMTSNQSSDVTPTGWDGLIREGQSVGGVARHSDRLVILTLDAFGTYDITRTETISVLIPDDAQNPEQEIHPGADAGPGVINFPNIGDCTFTNDTGSLIGVQFTNTTENIGSQDFNALGVCTAVGDTGNLIGVQFTNTTENIGSQNFPAIGSCTFVNDTSML